MVRVDAYSNFLGGRRTKVVRSSDSVFDYDAVQVRATARVSFGFPNPAGVVRIYDTA